MLDAYVGIHVPCAAETRDKEQESERKQQNSAFQGRKCHEVILLKLGDSSRSIFMSCMS